MDIKMIRKMKDQLASCSVTPNKNGDFYGTCKPVLTVDGVVLVGLCMIHPDEFKEIFGKEAFEELLKQPRVPNPYGEDAE